MKTLVVPIVKYIISFLGGNKKKKKKRKEKEKRKKETQINGLT